MSEGRHGHGTGPSDRARLHQAEHDSGHPQRAGEGAGQVEAPPLAFGLDDDDPAEQPDGHADGDVHEHDPAPRDELGEQPAGHQPGGPTGGRHRRVEADGPDPLLPFGEHRGEERERRRCGQGGTDPLGRPGRKEHPAGRGQAADERAQGEDGDPDQEGASAAEQVAGPGAEQQQAAEGQDVGVQHPRQGTAREAQALLDVGRATLTMVVSRTTIIWAVRITKRKTEGWLSRCRSVPGGLAGGGPIAAGRRVLQEVSEGIDYFLPAGRIQAEASSG